MFRPSKDELNLIWNTATLVEYNHLMFDNLLTESMISSDETYIKVTTEDNTKEMVTGFVVKKKHKDNPVDTNYFIRTEDAKRLPLLIDPNQTIKVAYSRKIYYLVTSAKSVKITPEKIYSWRELIDYSGIPYHTKLPHWVLYKNKRLYARLASQQYYRVISESGFGKDKYAEGIRLLLNSMSSISDPTPANLFFRACHNSDITINELPSTANKDDFLKLCNMLMRIGDGTKILDNRARKTEGTTDTTDISKLSVVFTHNVAEYYKHKGLKSFEEVYPFNVINRYFPTLYEGFLKAKLNSNVDYAYIAEKYKDFFKAWIKSALWYEENWHKLENRYKNTSLSMFEFKDKEDRFERQFKETAKCLSHYAKTEQEYFTLLVLEYEAYKKAREQNKTELNVTEVEI